MKIFKLTIPGDCPTKKNSGRMIKRGRAIFRIPNAYHEAWHDENMLRLRQPVKPFGIVQEVSMTIYPKTARKSDLTNKAESIMDLLVDLGYLEDDNWTIVPAVSLKFGGIDKLKPRVEVEIKI